MLRTLGSNPAIRLWRANSGVAEFMGRKVRFGVKGQADLSGILADGRRLEVECKSATGRQSVEQVNFQRMIEKFNGVYLVARSADSAVAQLKNLGYWRD